MLDFKKRCSTTEHARIFLSRTCKHGISVQISCTWVILQVYFPHIFLESDMHKARSKHVVSSVYSTGSSLVNVFSHEHLKMKVNFINNCSDVQQKNIIFWIINHILLLKFGLNTAIGTGSAWGCYQHSSLLLPCQFV